MPTTGIIPMTIARLIKTVEINIKLSKNVSHESAEGLVISDNTTITNSFNSIVYEGNVVSTFKNQKND